MAQTFRVLCCGDRNWTDRQIIHDRLVRLANEVRDLTHGFVWETKNITVVEGEANGADKISRQEAVKLGMEVESHPANWEKYHRAAGPIRNAEMLSSGVDLVLAFHDDLSRSKGTADMVKRARKAGVSVEVIGHGDC